MPRPNRGIEGLVGGPCKIRKRGCSSSSSSSSVLQNYRFKRAILVGKRGGSSTPVPTWKMSSRSPSPMAGVPESPKYQPSQAGGKAKQAPISARKLAATLWELNEIPSPRVKADLQERRGKKETRGKERVTRSVQSGSLPPHLSDPSHSPVSEAMDRSTTSSLRRRMSMASQRLGPNDRTSGGLDSMSNASLMEIETRSRGLTPSGSITGGKSRLRDLSNGLTTSKELLKILNRIWGVEEQHSSSMSLVSALRGELERARVQVDQLIQEQKSDRDEINYLMKRFAEEKAAWKSKEREKITAAVQSIVTDLEKERKQRKRTENVNAKLSRELAETKAMLSKALKELESERREKEIMEQVCDELARGIGEDKAEVEELKRESAKVREEVEKEREMLQLADVWREERVQMKLSEAKFQFEEKNAAVDKLRNELEAYLRTKRMKETRSGHRNHSVDDEDLPQLINLSKKAHLGNDGIDEEGEVEDGEEAKEDGCEDDDDSAESDLHSIELNMDNNSKSYKWSYANGISQEDAKRASFEEETKGRKSASERIPRGGAISLDRSLSEGIEWDFSTENHRHWSDGSDQGRFSESHKKHTSKEDYNEEAHRYKSVKGLRDHILSGSRITSAQGFASPTRQWSPQWPSHDPIDMVRERSKAGEKVRGVSGSKAKGEGQNSRHKQSQFIPKQ
ncbi:uncharacterized protein At5g41620 [Magnolia sinica]|uniref:uncharacterized protein At5g41620 n=1 Tax=Magnolia sinica TaxID=86752 RepID=UPI00265A6360|nr:uncharacterized protein At5g41620 [Magnolia sinica]